eukprot:162198-Hanusia_phi.AAC.1
MPGGGGGIVESDMVYGTWNALSTFSLHYFLSVYVGRGDKTPQNSQEAEERSTYIGYYLALATDFARQAAT